jgi:nucleoside-diphosphate-sugar epimerase
MSSATEGSDGVVTVVVDGHDTDLGRRVVALARTDPGVAVTAPRSRHDLLDGDHLVVLAPGSGPDVDGTTVGGIGLSAAVRLLDHTTARQVIVLSSAMVYGAGPDTPVPLTEDDPVRPEPGSRFALAKVELERAADELRARRPGTRVAVLRPPVVVAGRGHRDWLERSDWHAHTTRLRGPGRVAQFLHVEDLARAVEFCRRGGLDGTFNVAPDGWLTEEEQLGLVGAGRPPRLEPEVGRWWSQLRWSVGHTSTPPDLYPYTRYSWVVDNARLRARGWEPVHTNEEAFVQGHRPGWWSALTPDRRQSVALGVVAVVLAAVLAGVAVAVGGFLRSPRRDGT